MEPVYSAGFYGRRYLFRRIQERAWLSAVGHEGQVQKARVQFVTESPVCKIEEMATNMSIKMCIGTVFETENCRETFWKGLEHFSEGLN